MGFLTPVLVLNDHLHRIAEDGSFGKHLADQIHEQSMVGSREQIFGPHSTQVLPSMHADTAQIVVIHANRMDVLAYGWSSDPEECLKRLADQLGYTIRKKPGQQK